VSETSTTYTVTTLVGTHKIVAKLATPLPAGVTLTVSLQPPSGVNALGPVSLTTSDKDVVGPIPSLGACTFCSVTYTLSARATTGSPVSTTARSVVFSLVAGP
jgi:hypothetical protein